MQPTADQVVAPRRTRHRHDLAMDKLVALCRLTLEAQVLSKIDSPERRIRSHAISR
jgi:hypothetical protein